MFVNDMNEYSGVTLSLQEIDVHAEDDQGRTPLHYALEKQHDEVIETLLDRGAR